MISQIQLTGIKNIETCSMMILEHKAEVLAKANEADPVLVSMGGGAFEVETRPLQTEEGPMVIVHLLVDTKDAMGANAVNTMAEKVAPLLAEITGGRPYLRILSNLAVHRLARVRVHVTKEVLGGEAVVDGVLQAYAFANNDPYRACTNNKGIMNGSSPVACATGNDIRALEAGAHAYAGISGHYRPIVHWEKDNNGDLNGMIELPTAVGIVGGTTKTHPLAGVMLRMMHVKVQKNYRLSSQLQDLQKISGHSEHWQPAVFRLNLCHHWKEDRKQKNRVVSKQSLEMEKRPLGRFSVIFLVFFSYGKKRDEKNYPE